MNYRRRLLQENPNDLCQIGLIEKHTTNMGRCQYIADECSDIPEFINYFKIHYCVFDESWILSIFVIVSLN